VLKRTQVLLEEEMHAVLRRKAYEERKSMGAVIRDALARCLPETVSDASTSHGSETLVEMPPKDVADALIETYKKGVDRSLLRENLELSVEDRLRKLMQLQKFAEELRRSGRRASK
jgi:hypothetical protein